ncbi:uncharacterized protein KY384_002548 [Bacidia gigantensis]|uniref:uncharacterized protein n=1 Tax=Bacidia gigantensis TaxID=2732470 RepID=UPI001D0494DA|nr:uncharacterized protein KY384_002548 [Bacidia gigantensis]KAG8532671.1 hypothetical protein KY384_002548 [Bacidia gigantensis]
MASQPSQLLGGMYTTRVLPVDISKIGDFTFSDDARPFLDDWSLQQGSDNSDYAKVQEAALLIRHSDVPVAFPTETVYGLGADATRSSAVQGIYRAKNRPSDNPLIVHISSLPQLRKLLREKSEDKSSDPIPQIYHPLIDHFWPGPLTILLPLPRPSPFAPEVTSTLQTVGVRMPSQKLALALIQMAGVPVAAPSANASGKPSPTTASHVKHDLDGRIELILDGGPCEVGVESTVVDGLSKPPLILRPGHISLEVLRQFPGWEDVQVGYSETRLDEAPKAPGMKYRHYSPRARVILVKGPPSEGVLASFEDTTKSVGIILTGTRVLSNGESCRHLRSEAACHQRGNMSVWTISIGPSIADIARGLFSALRELDDKRVDLILVEGIDENQGDAAAAVMNRLRKAAETEVLS